ncbi:MAG: FtsK/SpoIIIE domain-containing protein [Parachlamydiaceae bacterium]
MFKAGGIYLTHKSGTKTLYITPKVQSVRILESPTRLEYVFTVPTGLDPKEITKRPWLFAQVFGEHYELEQRNKRFILTVYSGRKISNKYDYDAISNTIRRMKMPIYCGIDDNHKPTAFDMLTSPHLLIAGESGSGKSTQLRSVLTSLILSKSPSELHFYLADMKRSEFPLFRRVEHVKAVCTRVSELMVVLTKLRKETERRGDLLDQFEVTHIDDLPRDKQVPYIVLCVDEVALLKKEKEAMEIIEDISAIGRALGLFLMLSMQRPDSKVLDGKLKVNLTARMGFRTADAINSRIIGTPGSERIDISEKGRFCLKMEQQKTLQAPFLSVDRAKELLEPYKVVITEKQDVVIEQEEEPQEESEMPIFGLLGGNQDETTR